MSEKEPQVTTTASDVEGHPGGAGASGSANGGTQDQRQSQRRRNNSSNRRGNSNDTNVIANANKDFEGETKDVGGVLGLQTEKITHKVSFDTFCEKVNGYMIKNLDYPDDVVGIVKK